MRIGVIGAMQIEVDNLKASMSDISTKEYSGVTYVCGTIGDKEVVAAVCGIGKVFAAICAEAMILEFHVDYVINIGVGGTLCKELGVMDVAVADKVVQHDMNTTPLGDPVGLLSGINEVYLPTDEKMCRLLGSCLAEKGIHYHVGTIATGDLFVSTPEQKTKIHERFDAIACEMEGGSIGHVCYVNKVPFAILRSISDGEGASMDYATFAEKAALQSILVVIDFIQRADELQACRKIGNGFLVMALICCLMFVSYQATSAVITSAKVGDRELPIYCVDTTEKKVALSFDAAWGAEDFPRIMDVLDKHKVKVTFFMTGGWVEDNPDCVKELVKRGHDLGNHSEHHYDMTTISQEEKDSELKTVHDKVKKLTGYEMYLFRPPYGAYDNDVIKTAYAMHYYPIQWSVDSLDWKNYGVDSIITTVCNHKALAPGAIILCHNGAKYTADALDAMLTNLEEQGYKIVPISKLIMKKNYHMDATGKQIADDAEKQKTTEAVIH